MKRMFMMISLFISLSGQAYAKDGDTIAIAACCKHGQTQVMDSAEQKWKELAEQNNLKILYKNAEELQNPDKSTQITHMREMIDKGAKVVLVMMVQGQDLIAQQKEFLEYAKSKNVSVIAYNREPAKTLMVNYPNLYYVGSNPNAGGIFHGDMIKSLSEKNPDWDKNKDGTIQYILLQGTKGANNETARTTYVQKTLNNSSNIKFEQIAAHHVDWNRNISKQLIEQYIDEKNIEQVELIICNSDDIALGALDAFKAKSIKALPITSINGTASVREAIHKNEFAGAIYQNLPKQQEVAFKLAMNLLDEKPAQDGIDVRIIKNKVNVPWEIITKENVEKYIEISK